MYRNVRLVAEVLQGGGAVQSFLMEEGTEAMPSDPQHYRIHSKWHSHCPTHMCAMRRFTIPPAFHHSGTMQPPPNAQQQLQSTFLSSMQWHTTIQLLRTSPAAK
jgi:hypothetical protein